MNSWSELAHSARAGKMSAQRAPSGVGFDKSCLLKVYFRQFSGIRLQKANFRAGSSIPGLPSLEEGRRGDEARAGAVICRVPNRPGAKLGSA
jgi:hypothetical protein